MGQKTTAALNRIAIIVAEDRLTAGITMSDQYDPVPPPKAEVDEILTEEQVSADDSVGSGEDPVLPTEAEVVEALTEAQVSVDDSVRSRIAEFINLASRGELPAEVFVVAEGKPAREGMDEEFVWDELFDKNAQDWQEDDPVNYYAANSIVTVAEGVTVGTITPLVHAQT